MASFVELLTYKVLSKEILKILLQVYSWRLLPSHGTGWALWSLTAQILRLTKTLPFSSGYSQWMCPGWAVRNLHMWLSCPATLHRDFSWLNPALSLHFRHGRDVATHVFSVCCNSPVFPLCVTIKTNSLWSAVMCLWVTLELPACVLKYLCWDGNWHECILLYFCN